MATRLAERTDEELATLVAELRSAAGCPTRRLSRGGHEFVLAKHTQDTATEFAATRELLWIAGATRVTTSHLEKLQSSAGAVDASRATVVTIGSGTVEPSLEETVDHLSEADLRAAMRRTDDLSAPPDGASSATTTGSTDANSTAAGAGTGSEPGETRSAAQAESDSRQSDRAHTRSTSESGRRSLVERVSGPLVIADTWNGTTTAHRGGDSRSAHWHRTTHAVSARSNGPASRSLFDGSTTEYDDAVGE